MRVIMILYYLDTYLDLALDIDIGF